MRTKLHYFQGPSLSHCVGAPKDTGVCVLVVTSLQLGILLLVMGTVLAMRSVIFGLVQKVRFACCVNIARVS